MFITRQFRISLYALLILGMTGFALAAQSPGLWVLSVGATLINIWLVKTGRFQPMPRWIANSITVLSVLFLYWLMSSGVSAPILVIGEFLVLLQLVKLYEQRSNRDYSQLLVLGPLLMVAGTISTYSVVFGLLFLAYLFLAMYCCLLFHLKVEGDAARQAIESPQLGLRPAGADRATRRTVRRISELISVCAIVFAVGTFLFFPRGPGMGMLGPAQWKPSQTLTGFSDSVNFQNVAMITLNNEKIAFVTATRDGLPYGGILLLRGLTLDQYSGKGDPGGGNAYQWTRSHWPSQGFELQADDFKNIVPETIGSVRQIITLDPTGTNVLFAMGGLVSFRPQDAGKFKYSQQDQVLVADAPITHETKYEVVSNEQLHTDVASLPPTRSTAEQARLDRIDPKIEEFARLPEVSGVDEVGALAERRPKAQRVTALDATIAQNIARYFRARFTYTLDLTDAASIAGKDPIVAFLYDLKRGHCEYFAGAMTLMCQSLGMQARMVVGFRCSDYNPVGNFYTVRQSHAHAWVEVLDDQGDWITFDPTSGREDDGLRNDTVWQKARSLFSFLQYTWANSVVAYDPATRGNLIQDLDTNLSGTATQSQQVASDVMDWVNEKTGSVFGDVINGLVVALVAMLLTLVGWVVIAKIRLGRRARRIGLTALPSPQRTRLARQLRFYDDLMRLLARRRIRRPVHFTPMEFSDSLTFLPVEAFGSVRRLTDAFYRVRYGHADLSDEQRRGLDGEIARLQALLRGI